MFSYRGLHLGPVVTTPTWPDFSAIDVMAAGCTGLHRQQRGREGGRQPTPQVSFRELPGPSHSRIGPGRVMWVLADVVGDVHLATMQNPSSVDPVFLGCQRGPRLDAW